MSSENQPRLFDVEPEQWQLDDAGDWLCARVVFAGPPFGPYDYLIPAEWESQLQVGMRVEVPLGAARHLTGYCIQIISPGDPLSSEVKLNRLKPIRRIVDAQPLIRPQLLPLAQWIADYYLCSVGTAIEAIIPAGVREQAGTREVLFYSLADDFGPDEVKLTPTQSRIVQALRASGESLTLKEILEAAGCTAAPVNNMRSKGWLATAQRRIQQRTHEVAAEDRDADLPLNADQKLALEQIGQAIRDELPRTFLMLGITGSGKTEVYIRAIQEIVAQGKQAIVLVPEISLTPQTRQRFRSRFERIAVLHSHLSSAERSWHWNQIAEGKVDVVIGARSAVFAPVPRLGLIVIDEEHDGSFKQDQTPRYHARDVALWRSRQQGVPLVLGSATPSLESYQQSQVGAYELISLPRRALDMPLPDVATIDMRADYQPGRAIHPISQKLRQEIRQAIDAGGQVILLLNRRGYATRIQCPGCGETVYCPDCSIPMTHHREGAKLVCHYCDFQMQEPNVCPNCRFPAIRFSGLGTQRLEQYILSLFPDIPCARMDTDTMRKPGSHELALAKFRSGETKILLGTQMIAKGLDFPNVTLVGVVNADSALHFPDFRAAERTFGLVTQVAGRSGRGSKGGRVLVQTFSPEHPAIIAASRHDYVGFAQHELPLRERSGFPPFGNMARLVVRSESAAFAEQAAVALADRVRGALPAGDEEIKILGPAPAPVEKLRGKFRFHTIILAPAARPLQPILQRATADVEFSSDIQWIVDIDPLDML